MLKVPPISGSTSQSCESKPDLNLTPCCTVGKKKKKKPDLFGITSYGFPLQFLSFFFLILFFSNAEYQ